jgi:hypothetical protein
MINEAPVHVRIPHLPLIPMMLFVNKIITKQHGVFEIHAAIHACGGNYCNDVLHYGTHASDLSDVD